jgi:hypothetical protein
MFKHNSARIQSKSSARLALLGMSASLAVATAALTSISAAHAKPTEVRATTPVVNFAISETEVRAAQEAWGRALVQISTEHDNKGAKSARTLAKNIIDAAYGYQYGAVLFKPTLTTGEQTFRTTAEGALAYFAGGNKAFPNDNGFAFKGWRSVKIDNAGVFINGDMAITMGKVHLTDKNGQVTTVDKTWGFKKDTNGNLRIVLHHSSLPYVDSSSRQARKD